MKDKPTLQAAAWRLLDGMAACDALDREECATWKPALDATLNRLPLPSDGWVLLRAVLEELAQAPGPRPEPNNFSRMVERLNRKPRVKA